MNGSILRASQVVRRAAPTRVGFLLGADIEPINDLDNKPGKVIFRQPFIDRGWKKVAGLAVNRMEANLRQRQGAYFVLMEFAYFEANSYFPDSVIRACG
jgi:hypothetical protein